jgi:hypothetical protein
VYMDRNKPTGWVALTNQGTSELQSAAALVQLLDQQLRQEKQRTSNVSLGADTLSGDVCLG